MKNHPVEIPRKDKALFQEAWDTAREHLGWEFTFYLPGMIRYHQERGRYPAISITGNHCELSCEHCKGHLLDPMIHVTEPEELVERGLRLEKTGAHGILLSGGADRDGRLPWRKFLGAIRRVSEETRLFISAHAGFPDLDTCRQLKNAGVTQALVDVMGDDETASEVYHLEGLKRVQESLESISESGLELAPHIVAGLYYGSIRAEQEALQMVSRYSPSVLVIVVLSALKDTPMAKQAPPSPLEVARLVAKARLLMPQVPISLGCERPRNRQGEILEKLAIMAGATRMAVWSEAAVDEAISLGLNPRFQPTCCSVHFREEFRLAR